MSKITKDNILGKSLLFDTTILKNIFHRDCPTKEKTFWKFIVGSNYVNRRKPDTFVISTFTMMLEGLSVTHEQLDPFSKNTRLNNKFVDIVYKCDLSNPGETLAELLRNLVEWFDTNPLLTADSLNQLLEKEILWRSEYGQQLFIDLFKRNLLKKDAHKTWIKRMAFSALQDFNYRNLDLEVEKVKKLDLFMLGTYKYMSLNDYRGYSYAKVSDDILREAYRSNGKTLQPAYDSTGEKLDGEIVHFAAIGIDQDTKLKPVAIFTAENLSSWKSRIHRYYSFLSYLLEEENALIYPGTIYQIDQTSGEFREKLDLYEEFGNELVHFRLGQNEFLRK